MYIFGVCAGQFFEQNLVSQRSVFTKLMLVLVILSYIRDKYWQLLSEMDKQMVVGVCSSESIGFISEYNLYS